MKISFVIPAYNEERFLGPCLESVRKEIERHVGEWESEIIVVNNASQDRTREVALAFPEVCLVDEPRKGTGFARARGFEEATGEYLVFLDADTRLPDGWITRAYAVLEGDTRIVSLSGPYRYYDGSLAEKFFLGLLWWLSAPLTYFFVGYMILGGNLIVKREALRVAGGFDTSIPFYGDDTNVARRLSRFGRVIFDMRFFVYSSCRRFQKHGYVKMSWLYAMNFLSEVFFKKPYSL